MKITEFLSKLVAAVNAEIAGTPIVELANIATLNDGDEFLLQNLLLFYPL
jgi:hypothetical protein